MKGISRAFGQLVSANQNAPRVGNSLAQSFRWSLGEHRDFWHSSAHLLGSALTTVYGDRCFLVDGPAVADGFYYDAFILKDASGYRKWRMHEIQSLSPVQLLNPNTIKRDIDSLLSGVFGDPHFIREDEFTAIEEAMRRFANANHPFESTSVTREQAASIFGYSPFKLALINRIPEGEPITVYKCGEFTDLCRGPHISSLGQIRSFKLAKINASQWMPDTPHVINRLHGISFESKDKMAEYTRFLAEAAKRNHRTLGMKQKLFSFDTCSPGSPFFLPHGTRIINRLLGMLRRNYDMHGYEEVITPMIYEKSLWQKSGHWENYRDDMFTLDHKNEQTNDGMVHGLKPMNCPGHCLIFKQQARSHRELPMRLAEFSALHRVRKFHQDDAHIFCAMDQIVDEIRDTLQMIDNVYSTFGFQSYELALSTRPESGYIGSEKEWDAAEQALERALQSTGRSWKLKPGDGAFYGPKIDIQVADALGRMHQTATIQLDFQLPLRFNLEYQDATGSLSRPVIIHRAILGSIERMLGILTEHYAGKWPFWLSPRQCMVIPVSPASLDYARRAHKEIAQNNKFHVDTDDSEKTFNKKIRDAQMAQYNFIAVIGEQEERNGTVSLRTRDGSHLGEFSLQKVCEKFQNLTDSYQ